MQPTSLAVTLAACAPIAPALTLAADTRSVRPLAGWRRKGGVNMITRAMTCCWLTLALAVSAMADTIHVDVNGGGDYVSIGEGVGAASDGDTVLVAPGTYTGPENLGVDFEGKNLYLSAVAGPASTTIEATSEDIVAILLHTGEDTTSVIQGFTITGAYTAVVADSASPVIDNCVIRDPVDDNGAVGIRCVSSAATIRRSQFLWDCDYGYGRSGIYCSGDAAPLVRRCTFTTYGSGIVVGGCSDTVLVRDCEFVNCIDWIYGGAGARVSSGHISLEDCLFYNCTTENPMHAIGVALRANGANVNLKRVQFLENGTPGWSPIELSVLHVLNGYPASRDLRMDEVVFWGNNTRWSTIDCAVDSLVVRRSTLADNVVMWAYPLIGASYTNSLTIEDCVLAYNTGSELLDAPNAVTSHSCIFGNSMGDSLGGTHYENLFAEPLFCGRLDGDLTLHDDSPCLPANNPWGVLMGAYGAGDCGTGIDDGPASVTSAHIRWIRPNPSTSSGSRISLAGIPQSGGVVSIFDLRGRLVRSLSVGGSASGRVECVWDLEDDRGRRVSSGVYFVELSCSGVVVDRAKAAIVR
jgi:hypothetical protein